MRVLVCLFVCCPYYCIRSTYTFGGCTHLEMAIFWFFLLQCDQRLHSMHVRIATDTGTLRMRQTPQKLLIAIASIFKTSYLADSDNFKELLLFSFYKCFIIFSSLQRFDIFPW